MKRLSILNLIRLLITLTVIGFFAISTVFGVALFQHFYNYNLNDHIHGKSLEHGFPFVFYEEEMSNNFVFTKFHFDEFLFNLLIYFTFFTLMYCCYWWLKSKYIKHKLISN